MRILPKQEENKKEELIEINNEPEIIKINSALDIPLICLVNVALAAAFVGIRIFQISWFAWRLGDKLDANGLHAGYKQIYVLKCQALKNVKNNLTQKGVGHIFNTYAQDISECYHYKECPRK